MTKAFYKDATGAFLIYDITNRDSFERMKNLWYNQVKTYSNLGIRCILIGNKLDLVDKREVSINEGEAFAEEIDVDFVEVSAKTGENVQLAFRKLILSVAKKLPDVKIHLELTGLPEGWLQIDCAPEQAQEVSSNNEITITNLEDSPDMIDEKGNMSGDNFVNTNKPNFNIKCFINYWTGEKIFLPEPPTTSAPQNLIRSSSLVHKMKSFNLSLSSSNTNVKNNDATQ